MGESAAQTFVRTVVRRLLDEHPDMPRRLERMGRDLVDTGWGKATSMIKPKKSAAPSAKPAWWEEELSPILDPFSRGAKQQLQERTRPLLGAAIAVATGLLIGSFLLGVVVGRRDRT